MINQKIEKDDAFYLKELLTVTLLPPESLKPTEKYHIPSVENLCKKITNDKMWLQPMLIERNHQLIMDGHHRHQVAKRLDLVCVPCLLLSYDNPYVSMLSRMPEKCIQIKDVLKAGLTGNLLDYKSTCHQLLIPSLLSIQVPLEILMHKADALALN